MKKVLSILTVLTLLLNMSMTVIAQENQDNSVFTDKVTQRVYVESENNVGLDSPIEGYIDLDYWFDKVPGMNTYDLYATIKSDVYLTNFIQCTYSVKDTSILFPDTFMDDKYISKSYTASKYHQQYIGRFTVPSNVDKVRVLQENLRIYNLTKGMWVNFGNWSGAFTLPKY